MSNTNLAAHNDKVAILLKDVGVIQTNFKNARGRRALAEMVATTFKTIAFVISKAEPNIKAELLTEFQINTQRVTCEYAQFAAVCWGEPDAEKTIAVNLRKVAKWVPDKNMNRYVHTLLALSEADFDHNSDVETMIDWIIGNGGAQTIANERQRARSGKTEAETKLIAERKTVYEADVQPILSGVPANLPSIALPDDASQYFTLVCSKREDGTIAIHGVANKDGTSAFDKLAKSAYDGLVKARADAAMKAKGVEEHLAREAAKASGLQQDAARQVFAKFKERLTPSQSDGQSAA